MPAGVTNPEPASSSSAGALKPSVDTSGEGRLLQGRAGPVRHLLAMGTRLATLWSPFPGDGGVCAWLEVVMLDPVHQRAASALTPKWLLIGC